MGIEQKVLTEPTFINSTLLPAGSVVSVDAVGKDEIAKPGQINAHEIDRGDGKMVSNTPNLADVGTAPVLIPTEVAAIAPTGPHPTAPQQVPPGSMQMGSSYANGESLLVAQGHPDFQAMSEGAADLNDGVEEEAIQRLGGTMQDAGTATGNGPGDGVSGTNGTETSQQAAPFSTDAYIGGTIDAADFSGLTAAQLDAVQTAEASGQNRAGMLAKIEAARAAL